MDSKTEKQQDEHAKALRKLDSEGGVADVPEPQHGDPTAEAPPALGEGVLGVRVGSEASVASGTGPVLPPPSNAGGAFTRVRNADLRARDEAEFKKRGLSPTGVRKLGVEISASFEGLMAVEDGTGTKPHIVAGSYRGVIPPEGLKIRPLTEKELKEQTAPAEGATTATGARSTH